MDCSNICRRFTFKQSKAMHIHMQTQGCQTLVTKTSKTTIFELISLYDFILLNNPIHQYNIFLLASFFQVGEEN